MDIQFIKNIFKERLALDAEEIMRFTTGNCHYVYRVNAGEAKFIIRIASEENRIFLKGSIYWLEKACFLKPFIPEIVVDGSMENCPFVILKYISGNDLGDVYFSLTKENKKNIARRLAELQKTVEMLHLNRGFGYLSSYEDDGYKESWVDVIYEHLERSKNRIRYNGIFDVEKVERVKAMVNSYLPYFERIATKPFLDDISTKNVLIENGELSGIIDVDCMCFGDKLYIVALTKMALISMGAETDYIDFWMEAYKAEEIEKKVLELYTLIFCLDFMGERGMKFNKEIAPIVSKEEIAKFNRIYEELYLKLKKYK